MKIYINKIKISVCLLLLIVSNSYSQFSSGNITVFQAGDGSNPLSNTGNPIVLKEFSTSGVLTYSMTVPNTSTVNSLVVSGSATSEGLLSRSNNGLYLVFTGYSQSLPNLTNVTTASSTLIPRSIGIVGAAGLSSFSIASTNTLFFSGSNIRGATATDNSNFWASGSSQGTNYYGTAATPTTIQNTKLNLRAINIFNNQLYASSQVASGTPTDIGVYAIGTGTSTSAGQTASCVIITGASSQPAQFYFNSGNNICYVADMRNSSLGGIQKWVNASNTWTLAYTLSTGSAAIGATGVVADFSGLNPIIYATTNESISNRLISILDQGALSSATTLATASTSNTIFRGLAFSPTCNAPTLTISATTASICSGQSVALNASGAQSYTISSGLQNGATFNPSVTTVYTVTGNTNGCITSNTILITVNQLPLIISNSITICLGQQGVLSASGANSYSWSTGSSSSTISVSPAVNTSYTVIGTSLAGCQNSIVTQVAVASSPSITVNSITICSGKSATLIAGGVSTYTWSNGALTNSIIVTPTTNTTYSLAGNLSGCPGLASNTVNVNVNPTPTITIIPSASLICRGNSVSLTPIGALTYTWTGNNSGGLLVLSPTVTSTYSVFGTSSLNCSSNSQITIIVSPCTGIEFDDELINDVVIYPNPAKEKIELFFNDIVIREIQIKNSLGQNVYSLKTNENKITIDLNEFKGGLYFIQIITPKEKLNKKIIVQ